MRERRAVDRGPRQPDEDAGDGDHRQSHDGVAPGARLRMDARLAHLPSRKSRSPRAGSPGGGGVDGAVTLGTFGPGSDGVATFGVRAGWLRRTSVRQPLRTGTPNASQENTAAPRQ